MSAIWQCTECRLVFTTGDSEPSKPWSGCSVVRPLVCNECGTQHELHIAQDERGEPYTIFYEAKIVSVSDDARVSVMGELRRLTDFSLADAKGVLGSLPVGVGGPVAKEDAARMVAVLTALGAEATVSECSRELNFAHVDELQQDKLIAANGPLFEYASSEEEGFPPVVREVTGPRSGPRGHVDLPCQPCGHCAAVGTLTAFDGTPERCPHCRGERFEMLALFTN